MQKSVTVRGIGKVMKNLKHLTNGDVVGTAFDEIGQHTRRWVADWYRRKGMDWFDTPGSPTHGSGRVETNWAHAFMLRGSWSVQRLSARSNASILLSFSGDADKQRQFLTLARGATITPKAAAALTIPMIPQAHGLRAAEFARRFHKRLFRPKGKNYLADNTFGRVRVVYLLRRSVTIKPMLERNGHEPYAWNDPRFKPYVTEQMQKAVSNALGLYFGK